MAQVRKARTIPGFNAEQSAALFREFSRRDDEVEGLGRRDSATTIFTTNTVARAGQYLRCTPPEGGMAVLLPPPDRTVPGDRITIAIESPAGELAVVCVPNQSTRGTPRQGTVNGETRATFTIAGIVELFSNGASGWASQSELPQESPGHEGPAGADGVDGADGATGATGATGAAAGGATGTSDGFLARRVYANAASSLVGTTFFGKTVLAATTLSAASDLPDGSIFEVVCWGAGGSGAAGRQQTASGTSAHGSSGGGGGARNAKRFTRAELVAALPIVITVANTAVAPAVNTTAGTNQSGTGGGVTSFGSLVAAYGGGAGRQDSSLASGGSGGGFMGPGLVGTTGSVVGGLPGQSNSFGRGGAGAGSATDQVGLLASEGGGASGGSPLVGPTTGLAGGIADLGGGGGGASGGNGTGTTTANSGPGGAGGYSGARNDSAQSGNGGAGGAQAAVNTTGLPGATGATGVYAASGAGGGGGSGAPQLSGTGGKGGAGGIPAGGGGSGGAGRGANGTAWGGIGGDGGQGLCVLTALL